MFVLINPVISGLLLFIIITTCRKVLKKLILS